MAIVSKGGTGEEGGAGPAEAASPEPRTNLPPKTGPVVGRRPEMQAVANVFQRSQRERRPGRAEIVGRRGVGASTVAIELARRAGGRFPGGAWYLDLSLGTDLAWAELAAARGRGRVRNLAETAREERERLGNAPRALLVVDGARDREQVEAALPPEGPETADVFVVSEDQPTRAIDDIVEVTPVPAHAARRICQAVVQATEDRAAPAVRTTDGLALTAALAARAAMAWQGKAGPMLFDDTRGALMRLVPLVAQNPVSLELLLVCGVTHPARIPIDALFGAVRHVREGRGEEPTPEEVGNGVLWLARVGLLQPGDEHSVSIHPAVQGIVREMAKTEADLEVARRAFTVGLLGEVEAALDGDGVDLRRAALHQLRTVAAAGTDELAVKAREAVAKVESALGL